MELSDQLETKFPKLDDNQKRALRRLKIFSVADLLFHFPVRYSDWSEVKNIADLIAGDMATVSGKVSKLKARKAFRSKIPMGEGEIADLSGKIVAQGQSLRNTDSTIVPSENFDKCWWSCGIV